MTEKDWISSKDQLPTDRYEVVLVEQQGGYGLGRYVRGRWVGKRGNTPLRTAVDWWAHLPPHNPREVD